MKEYKFMQTALVISFSVHALAVFGSHLLPFLKVPQADKQVKITYLKIEKTPKDDVKLKPDMPAKRIPPPFTSLEDIRKEESKDKSRDVEFKKPELIKPEGVSFKKKVNLPPVDMAKIDNPTYLSYYQIVREKIRRTAFRNYLRSETGEVYATFIISSDGLIKHAQIIDEKSSVSSYLKGIALSSIRGASPFPNFPKELDYGELSFNVVIAFEVE